MNKPTMTRKPQQQPNVRERQPFKQDPRQCRHVYLELGREGGTIVFYCERCLHYEEKQLPAVLQPQEDSVEIAPRLGGDPLADI